MEDANITQIVIAGIIGIFGLFVWLLKLIVPALLKKIDDKDSDIKNLVSGFTETQNHKTTEMTNALNELKAGINELVHYIKEHK